jgi:predicted GH43/DUF377 family glycosyl hydrolase
MSDESDPRELFRRWAGNPILTAQDFPKMVNSVFNPAAAVVDGRTLLLLRVEYRTGQSGLAVATSADGLTGWEIDLQRGLRPHGGFEEHWGVEDPRITQIGDQYFVAYTGYSTAGPLVCLASTGDFQHWERYGALMAPADKDAALFPVSFGGRWALLHRPAPADHGVGAAHIWISFSPDLRHWGDPRMLLPARQGGWWDAHRVGIGPPPLLTRDGWLVCYHGVRVTAAGSIYRLGLALLDRDDPARVIARGNEWVFGPREHYERHGDVPDVVFPCGWILRDDGETLRLYYGAADSVVCVAEASLATLLSHLEQHKCEEAG